MVLELEEVTPGSERADRSARVRATKRPVTAIFSISLGDFSSITTHLQKRYLNTVASRGKQIPARLWTWFASH